MECKKCKGKIEDDSVYCKFCGKKQNVQERKPLKRSNGSGSVWKLSGRRRKPWVAEITKGYNETTKERNRIIIGYFEMKNEALAALAEVSINPISTKYNYTVAEVYEEWSKAHFTTLQKSGISDYEVSWNRVSKLSDMKMRDVRTENFQEIIRAAIDEDLSYSMLQKLKQLCSQLCKKAMEYDILNKNYASFIVLPKEEKKEKDILTEEEIKILFEHDNEECTRIILTLIYTGMRINELFTINPADVNIEEKYMIGGEKTDAGKNRVIPINSKIMPYVEQWYKNAIKNNYKYLVVNSVGKKKDAKNFREREFYPLLVRLKIIDELETPKKGERRTPPRITPHCTRHTFASLMNNAEANKVSIKKIIGHSSYAMTEKYTHKDIKELKKAIDKI